MSLVRIRPGEPIERALRVLKKKVDKEGTIKIMKSRRYYEKPSVRKRMKTKAALRYKKTGSRPQSNKG